MKRDIEFFLTKLRKILIGENYLYCIQKKERRNIEFLNSVVRIKLKKRDSLIFVRDNRRFYALPEYEYLGFKDEYLGFKGVLFYGGIAKLMKEYINIYELGGKNVYNKNDAFVLACEEVDNKKEFKLIKNNIEIDLKTFLETGEEKEKNEYNIYNQAILNL